MLWPVFLLCSLASSDVVYLVNNDNESPSTSDIYSVDISTKNITKLASYQSPAFDTVENTYRAVVCDQTYYGFWADVTTYSFGLTIFDIVSNEVSFVSTPVLYHAIACDPEDRGSLLSVGSEPKAGGAQFSLRRWNIANQTDAPIADIPILGFLGYDAAFVFNAAGTRLYVGGGSGQPYVIGSQIVVDVKSGQVVYGPTKYPLKYLPYTVFPDADPMTGILTLGLGGDHVFAKQLTFGEDKISVNRGETVENLFNSEAPSICGNTWYTTNYRTRDPWQLYAAKTATGEVTATVDLPFELPNHFVGGLACVST